MRKLLLPICGDPFIFNIINKNLQILSKYVDEIYICIDPQLFKKYPECLDFIKNEFINGIIINSIKENNYLHKNSYEKIMLGGPHGIMIYKLLSYCDPDDYILLLEDDCLIFDQKIVDYYFQL